MPALISPGTLSPGLLEELEHRSLRVAVDEPVGGGVLDRVQAEGRPRPALAVGAQQRGQVEVGENVAVEGEEALVQAVAKLVGGEADRAGGAAPLGLDHVGDRDPGSLLLAGQRLAQHVGQEAAGEDDLGYAVARQPLDHVGEEGPVDQRQRRLRHGLGQRSQPRPLPTYQDDRLHLFRRTRRHRALNRAAHSLVLEACASEQSRVEEVATVDQQRSRHPLGGGGPVELGELGPLGDQDRSVGAIKGLRMPNRGTRPPPSRPRAMSPATGS